MLQVAGSNNPGSGIKIQADLDLSSFRTFRGEKPQVGDPSYVLLKNLLPPGNVQLRFNVQRSTSTFALVIVALVSFSVLHITLTRTH